MSTNATAGTSTLVVASSIPSSIPSSLPASSSDPAESSAASSASPAETSSAVPTSASEAASSSEAAVSTPPPSSAEPSSSAEAPSTSAAPASSTQASPPPSSSQAPASSSQAPASSSAASSAPPASTAPPTTVVTTAPTPTPSTEVVTSVVTPSTTIPGQTVEPSTIVRTIVTTPSPVPGQGDKSISSTPSASGTAPAGLQGVDQKGTSNGLSAGGKTAIAVVVPVVVVAVLVIAGLFLWRRRKQKKNAEEARRKEVEEYGFNPNHDPTLPAVGMGSEMAEDQSGYRGWGNTSSSNRKASTTLTSGMTYSDSNSNPGGYQSPGSPTHGTDAQSNDPLVNGRRETLDSEGIGALGAAPNATQNQTGVNRGPSNASSSYSAAGHSDNSGDYPIPNSNPTDEYGYNGNYQPYPYNDGYGAGQQPVIRDVSARRNTRIESPSVFPQQGNSGIAQNF